MWIMGRWVIGKGGGWYWLMMGYREGGGWYWQMMGYRDGRWKVLANDPVQWWALA